MKVHQILKTKSSGSVITILPNQSLTAAAELLSANRIGSLVVSSDNESVEGVLSERDIVRELGRRGPSCMSDMVSDVMTKSVVCCEGTDTTDEVLTKMTEGRFRHMPVLEDGKMIGLVSIGDVVKAKLSVLSMEKDALEGMIMGH